MFECLNWECLNGRADLLGGRNRGTTKVSLLGDCGGAGRASLPRDCRMVGRFFVLQNHDSETEMVEKRLGKEAGRLYNHLATDPPLMRARGNRESRGGERKWWLGFCASLTGRLGDPPLPPGSSKRSARRQIPLSTYFLISNLFLGAIVFFAAESSRIVHSFGAR